MAGLTGVVLGNTRVFAGSDASNSSLLANLNSTSNAAIFGYLLAIRDHELAHVAALRSTITKLGGTPVEACSYRFDAVTSFETFLQIAQALENTGVSAYDGAINRITDKNLLQTAATIATVEARHAAYLNLLNAGAFSYDGVTDPMGMPSTPGVSSSPFERFRHAVVAEPDPGGGGPFLGTCSTPLPAQAAIATFSP